MAARRKAAAKRKSTGAKRKAKAAKPKYTAKPKSAAKSKSTAKRPAPAKRAPRQESAVAAPAISTSPGRTDMPFRAQRQVVVMTEPAREAAARPSTLSLMAPAVHVREVAAQTISEDIAPILARANATIAPLLTETQLMPPSRPLGLAAVSGEFATPQPPPADLGRYQLVTAPEDRIEDLATELNAHHLVAAAYVMPPLLPAPAPPRLAALGSRAQSLLLPAAAPPAPGTATPDFSGMQGYLNASPDGVDARWAWTQAGGRGDGVCIVDIEGGWCFEHEDLQHSVDGLVGGSALRDALWRDHGTAVLSEIVGEDNGLGVTGIAPNARIAAISHSGEKQYPAKAIVAATKRLHPGDMHPAAGNAAGRPALQLHPAQRSEGLYPGRMVRRHLPGDRLCGEPGHHRRQRRCQWRREPRRSDLLGPARVPGRSGFPMTGSIPSTGRGAIRARSSSAPARRPAPPSGPTADGWASPTSVP